MTCSRCEHTTYVEKSALGHTPGTAATCTENQICTICQAVITSKLGHSFTNYTSDNNATCTVDGTKTAKCNRCTNTNTITDVGSAGHKFVNNTCTRCGLESYNGLVLTLNGNSYSVTDYIGSATSVTIPATYKGASVTKIGNAAFASCRTLTRVTIPNTVTILDSNAFKNCYNLNNIEIPSSVYSIGPEAFYGCESLTSINIPDSVTYIQQAAFKGCRNLKTVTIGNGLDSIPEQAFALCEKLTTVNISNRVTHIKKAAFSNCSSLKSITIPDSVTTIHDNAFEFCSSLTNITIGKGVTKIGKMVFYQTSLTSVKFSDTTTWYMTTSSSYTNGTEVDVTNTTTNTTYFKDTHRSYYWYKK